ncbi:sigma factor [Brevundimonas sp.]|uniref:sigma factor n=1 Tax=Brevundimonas sp. TaxID=1871086 RepID=UPI003D6D498A
MSLRKPNDYAALDQADLVRLAQAGDREAFRAIMQQGNQRLFRIARGVVRDDAEAEDVLQEAYARAFAAMGGFRGAPASPRRCWKDWVGKGVWPGSREPFPLPESPML